VRAEKDGWLLIDNDSHNGTSVGTAPLPGGKSAEIRSGDLLTFGAFTVRVIDAAELYAVLRRLMEA
jgi:predicted component of type VI protein secretion system